mgnify:CR=1 FL=1
MTAPPPGRLEIGIEIGADLDLDCGGSGVAGFRASALGGGPETGRGIPEPRWVTGSGPTVFLAQNVRYGSGAVPLEDVYRRSRLWDLARWRDDAYT